MSLKNLTETGETIVEVLIVTLILTSVMATSFALTTRTLNQDRASQERSEAAGYAQSQIERLSVAVRDGTVQDPVLVPTQPANFCLVDGASPIASPIVSVSDINNVPAQCQSNDRYSGYISYDTATNTFTEKVVWENVVGNGKDNISLVYRPEFSQGSTTSTPAFTIPSPPPPPACPTAIPDEALQACFYNDTPSSPGSGSYADNALRYPISSTEFLADDFGLGSPSPSVTADYFSATYEGKFNFSAGNYRFKVGADDGVRLYVAGVLIIDQWQDQSYTTYLADKSLAAGQHIVKMEFYERTGYARATLSWGQTPF